MSEVKIKICGITRVEDALLASNLGAHAIGMVFYTKSPRAVSVASARALVDAVGPFLTSVALFVNPQVALVEDVLRDVRPHVLQFHGDEDAAFCEQFDRPYIKAIRVRDDTDIENAAARFQNASGLLFDAWSESRYGGTGKTFNWQKIADFRTAPMILAGGLTPENIATAIAQVRPYAVDVSGGVEAAHGVKDAEKLRRFIAEVGDAVVRPHFGAP